MTTAPAPSLTAHTRSLIRLYVVRAGLAVVWAIVFAATSSSLGVAATVLLIAYPAIDVLASVYDARTNPEAGAPLNREAP